MGAAALDPAPSAGACRDGSDLVLQSFDRAIDVALICRSIRIRGRLSTSGGGSRTSSAGSRSSDTFPRSSAGVPRQPLGVPNRSRSARESSEAARLRSVRVPPMVARCPRRRGSSAAALVELLRPSPGSRRRSGHVLEGSARIFRTSAGVPRRSGGARPIWRSERR